MCCNILLFVDIEKDRGGRRPGTRAGAPATGRSVCDGLPWCAATLSLDKVCTPSLVMFILTALVSLNAFLILLRFFWD